MGEVGAPGVETVAAVEFGGADGVAQREKGVAETVNAFDLGEHLKNVFAVPDVFLGFAGADAEIECGGEMSRRMVKGVDEPRIAPPEGTGLADHVLKNTGAFASDEGGGEAGVAEADERAGGDVAESGMAVFEKREKFVGDEGGERRMTGAFAPAGFFAIRGDEDEPRVGDFVFERIEDFDGADAITITFAIEEEREVLGAGRIAWFANPERALVGEVNAADRGGGVGHGANRRWKVEKCERRAGDARGVVLREEAEGMAIAGAGNRRGVTGKNTQVGPVFLALGP